MKKPQKQDILSRKVAVVGVGYVGSSITYALVLKGLAHEIVLIEQPEAIDKCVAEINDIRHGIPFMGSSNIYSGSYEDIKDCDLIIIASGRNRKPNESRLEMTDDNLKINKGIADEIKKNYVQGVVLVVTNPVDIISKAMTRWLGLSAGMVFGTGCILDSSRLTNVIADYVNISSDMISAHVIGEHGDGQIALWSKVMVAGIPIAEYCKLMNIPFTDSVRLDMEHRVRTMGTSIIKGKGRTHYGIASCVCFIADAILNRRPSIASVSSVLTGEYGINNVSLSLPSIISSHGVERRLEDQLSSDELARLTEVAAILGDAYTTKD